MSEEFRIVSGRERICIGHAPYECIEIIGNAVKMPSGFPRPWTAFPDEKSWQLHRLAKMSYEEMLTEEITGEETIKT